MEGLQTYSTSEGFKTVVEIVLTSCVLLLMIGCAVGPNYKRPLVNVPGEYRGKIAPDIASSSAISSVADEQWSAMFEDPAVERLVKDAIANNLDLQIAAQRVLQVQGERESNPPSQAAEPVVKCGYGSTDERSHGKTTDTGRDSADCGGICNERHATE